ncbi:MAG TPA: glycosyltransferase family 2 protein [Actinomycetota bacterium]|nr:glycosyltransferase family 2 protein [Actinomycetota bacterium]
MPEPANSTPLAAVVIPTHNRCPLLQQSVASVLAQTIADWELVVVDDASTDSTWEWLQQLEHPRVAVQHLEESTGGQGARNLGLAAVTAPYVLFLDDDDLLMRTALEEMTSWLDKARGAVAAVGGQRDIDDAGNSKRFPQPWIPLRLSPWRELLFAWNATPGRVLVKTDTLRSVGGWREGLTSGQDRELWLRLALEGDFLFRPTIVMSKRAHGQGQRPGWREIRDGVLDEAVAALPPSARPAGERALRSRRFNEEADELYLAGRSLAAARGYAAAIKALPRVAWSPLTAPFVTKALLKSLVGAVVGRRVFLAVRAVRWRLREALSRAPTKRPTPESDQDNTAR